MEAGLGDSLFLSGTASLAEQLDKMIVCVLGDGRCLVGILRSYDHFSNIVMEETRERRFGKGVYSDVMLGLYLVRGENIVLLGEVDEAKEAADPSMRPVEADELVDTDAEESKRRKQWELDC